MATLLLAVCVLVQVDRHPAAEFTTVVGGSKLDRGIHVTVLKDGGYAAVGLTTSYGKGNHDAYLVRTDAAGKVLWSKTYGGAEEDNGWSIHEAEDGFVLAGYTRSSGAGGYDFYLVRTDAKGALKWSRTYGGKGDDLCWALHATKDGGFLLAGETTSSGAGGKDCLLIKTDASGKELWSRTFGGKKDDRCFSIAPAEDGGYVLAGQTFSEGAGDRDAYVIKTDANGKSEWSRTFGGPESDVGHSICRTSDGCFFVTGYTTSFAKEGDDPYLIKLAADGTTRWTRVINLPGRARTITGEQTTDGGFACVGFSSPRSGGPGKALMIRTDALGRLASKRTFFGDLPGESFGYTVRATKDGGCVFTGHVMRTGSRDLFIEKVAGKGR